MFCNGLCLVQKEDSVMKDERYTYLQLREKAIWMACQVGHALECVHTECSSVSSIAEEIGYKLINLQNTTL